MIAAMKGSDSSQPFASYKSKFCSAAKLEQTSWANAANEKLFERTKLEKEGVQITQIGHSRMYHDT